MMETNPFAIVCVSEARIHCADAPGAMLRAEPFSNSIAVTTCIRALHFAGMMETNPFAIVCVPEARMHCADAEGAVLLADPFA